MSILGREFLGFVRFDGSGEIDWCEAIKFSNRFGTLNGNVFNYLVGLMYP